MDHYFDNYYSSLGLNIISTPHLPIKQHEKVRRVWRERLFSLPWRPWRWWKMVEVEGMEVGYKIGNNFYVSSAQYEFYKRDDRIKLYSGGRHA